MTLQQPEYTHLIVLRHQRLAPFKSLLWKPHYSLPVSLSVALADMSVRLFPLSDGHQVPFDLRFSECPELGAGFGDHAHLQITALEVQRQD